jgi:hypothetical protein
MQVLSCSVHVKLRGPLVVSRRWVAAAAAAVVLSGPCPASAAAASPAPLQTAPASVTTSPPLAGAGGESFMAGDGGVPYLDGTDVADNRCHRSTTSAVRLLHSAGLINLVTDTSCSGATINTFMTTGMYNEASQVSRIPPNLQVYFLGIGGNDIGFGMVSGCILQTDCTKTQVPAAAFEQITKLGPRLDTVYRAVKAAVPRGKVIVQLYPLILPPPDKAPGILCRPYLQPGEAQIGYDLTTRLNTVIKERAKANGLFTADPGPLFAGHDVCGVLTFFYPPGIRSTFHPNLAGRFALTWTNYSTYANN